MTTAIISYNQNEVMAAQVDTDSQLIALWLHGRPAGTQRQYKAAVAALVGFVARPLQAVGLAHMRAWRVWF